MGEALSRHGGYRGLKGFQLAQLVYDVTVRFCDQYIERRDRTHDQMVQAARSGVQNIAEGSLASATSKKTELMLTQVARASLEELKLDYEDFLRQRKMLKWESGHPLRADLVGRRCAHADEVAAWVTEKAVGAQAPEGDAMNTETSTSWLLNRKFPEMSANAALVLIVVTCSLIDRQVRRLASDFDGNASFTQRMRRMRHERRHDDNN